MELSLEEIIKKNKIGVNGGVVKKFTQPQHKELPFRKTLNKPAFKETRPPVDARMKIIQKNRAKIRDAREKLLEVTKIKGDARRLIDRRTSTAAIVRNGVPSGYRNGRAALPTRKIAVGYEAKPPPPYRRSNGVAPLTRSRLPNLVNVPRGYVDYDNMEQMEEEEFASARGLSRTVRNDMSMDTYSPPRADSITPPVPRRLNSWGSQTTEHYDPFDVYDISHARRERRMSPPELPPPPKGILRSSTRQMSPELYQRRYISDTSHLSHEMRSRLENAPDPHQSMGIFSNPLRSSGSTHHSPNGYRIVVSNLHPSVTQSDIKELFEDIGHLYDSRIVRPGIAEVIYKSLADAEKAVDTYHNRQLDRQPMKCLLVNPRASDKPTAPAIKTSSSNSRLASKTPLEIDIDALHKVLFRRH